MDAPEPTPPKRFRGLRRLLKIVLILALVVVGVSLIGTAAVWGHFWNFEVGATSSSTCSNCHVLSEQVQSLSDPIMLASNHANSGVTCVDCHPRNFEQQVTETIAYLTNNYTDPLPRLQVKMDTCFNCHEHGSYDQLAWRSTDLGVTDVTAKGNIANPHQPPHYSNLECNSCHLMHEPSTLLCSECHTYVFRMPVPTQEAP
ncbi:MAG: cytochrome c3 family protein [Anaerolineae bacterium]